MRMIATEFEFRRRSVLNLIHFWIAFQLYSFDHVNVVWAFTPWGNPRGTFVARIVFGCGAVLLAIAAATRTWAAAYLQSDVVHDAALHTERIVADGPYRHVRNPLYIGTFLMTVGLGLLTSRLGFLVLVVGAAIRILRLIGREEMQLEKERGERYREFCRLVPRLIPSLRPRVPVAGLAPRWGQAIWGEALMWGLFIAMVAFTVTLKMRVAYVLVGASVALWLFQRLTWANRERTSTQE
jgi:protein-S-isoprenylcysteine O-methyltransferase Ste14